MNPRSVDTPENTQTFFTPLTMSDTNMASQHHSSVDIAVLITYALRHFYKS